MSDREIPLFRTFLFVDDKGNKVYFTTVIVKKPKKVITSTASGLAVVSARDLDKVIQVRENPGDVVFVRGYIERWKDGKLVSRTKYDHGYISLKNAEQEHLRAVFMASFMWGPFLVENIPEGVIEGSYELPPPKESHEIFDVDYDSIPTD